MKILENVISVMLTATALFLIVAYTAIVAFLIKTESLWWAATYPILTVALIVVIGQYDKPRP